MAIIKERIKPPFVMIPKKMLFDSRLKPIDTKVLLTLYSLKEDWEFNVKGFAQICNVGRTTMEGCLSRLESYGYIKRVQKRDLRGKYACNDIVLIQENSCKNNSPCSDITGTDSRYADNKSQYNNKTKSKNDNKKRDALSKEEYESLVQQFGKGLVDEQINKVEDRHYQNCMNYETIFKWCTERIKRVTREKKSNKFNEFHQRDYEAEQLEKLMLSTKPVSE